MSIREVTKGMALDRIEQRKIKIKYILSTMI